jgi:hypothetical protein
MGRIFGLIGLVVVIGFGAYWYTSHAPANQSALEGGQNAIEKARDAKEMIEDKGMVSSIKDAMGLGTAMSCTYTMDSGGQTLESTVQVEGEKFRSESTIAGTKSYALSDGGTQYMWTSASNQGFKMSKECLEGMAAMAPKGTTDSKMPSMEDAKAALDMAKNVKCSPASSADFTLPSDITFTDQCAMMKDSMKMMEQYKDKMPAGMTYPAVQQ